MGSTGEKVAFWMAAVCLCILAVAIAQTVDVPKGFWSGVVVVGIFLAISFLSVAAAVSYRWWKAKWQGVLMLVGYWLLAFVFCAALLGLAVLLARMALADKFAHFVFGRLQV